MKAHDRILSTLAGCIGRDTAISAPQLARRAAVSEREVRRIISTHHDDCGWQVYGVLVCEPGLGFYFADDAEQVEREWLRKRRLRDEAQGRLKRLECLMQKSGFGGLLKMKRGGAEARRSE